MNYKSAEYIKQYNEELSKQCDWRIELGTDGEEEERENYYRLYHLDTYPANKGKLKFIGYFPIMMSTELLINCESLCHEYYRLGQTNGMAARISLLMDAQTSASLH